MLVAVLNCLCYKPQEKYRSDSETRDTCNLASAPEEHVTFKHRKGEGGQVKLGETTGTTKQEATTY